jgi:stage II sporulation protein AA (anti-sigma F factor antagonist)
MELQAKVSGSVLICTVTGELDHHTAEEFKTFVDYNLQNNPVKHLILDLSHLSFMDSSGIGAVIGRYKRVSSAGGRVVVANESKQVSRVFKVSGIYEIISSCGSIRQALNKLQKRHDTFLKE